MGETSQHSYPQLFCNEQIFWLKTMYGHHVARISRIELLDCGEQGWHSGESTCLPPMWPRFDSWTRRHMWIEFVVGSCVCSERFFFGYSGFPPPQKPDTFQFQFDLESVPN